MNEVGACQKIHGGRKKNRVTERILVQRGAKEAKRHRLKRREVMSLRILKRNFVSESKDSEGSPVVSSSWVKSRSGARNKTGDQRERSV